MKPIVIIGNGPSTRGVAFSSFKNIDSFGMNLAYRYYNDIKWWPTYYGSFDEVYYRQHYKEFEKMIEDPDIPIKKYFLLHNCCDHEKLTVVDFDKSEIGKFSTSFDTFGGGGNTGSNCCQAAICMGYDKLILIGIDCNFIEVLDEAEPTSEATHELLITRPIGRNSNYFIDDYHRVGERHNKPNAHKYHAPAWESLAEFAKENNVDIVNCSPISTLDCFRKSTLDKELS